MKKFFEKLREVINDPSPQHPEGRKGFTLAEVLIVITIIGVVAAITMFIWHGSTEGKEFDVGVKKMVSRLAQALRVNRVSHDFENWDDIFAKHGGDDIRVNFFGQKFDIITSDDSDVLKKTYKDGELYSYSAGDGKIYTLKDGVQYSLFQNSDDTLKIQNEPVKVLMVVDLNGIHKSPNKAGKDRRIIGISQNRAGEILGEDNSWCGDSCVKTELGTFKVAATDGNGNCENNTCRNNLGYNYCRNQNMVLASPDEIQSILSTQAGREAAGVENHRITCFVTREQALTGNNPSYTCYNRDNGKIATSRDWADRVLNDLADNTDFLNGKSSCDNPDDSNCYFDNWQDRDYANANNHSGALCVKDKALEAMQTKYPNAEYVVDGKAIKPYMNFESNESYDWHSNYDNVKAYCENYGMRLPTSEELMNLLPSIADKTQIYSNWDFDERLFTTTKRSGQDMIDLYGRYNYEDNTPEVVRMYANNSDGYTKHYEYDWQGGNFSAFCVGD